MMSREEEESADVDFDLLAEQDGTNAQKKRLVSLSLPCVAIDPMLVLGLAAGQERFYWQDPSAHVTYVGFGVAADLRAFGSNRFQQIAKQATALFEDAQISRDIPAYAEPQLFGGFAFSDDFTPDNTWSIYYPGQFILPHYQLAVDCATEGQQTAWLTINAVLDRDEEVQAELNEVMASLQNALVERISQFQRAKAETLLAQSTLLARTYPMNFSSWDRMLKQALAQFEDGQMTKVVLSRVCELRFQQNVDTDRAMAFLNRHYPDCYRFLFEPIANHVFFGASPELLINLQARTIRTMGLAGSERRGKSQIEDDALGQELLNSVKNQHEHKLVVDAIRTRLSPLCSQLSITEVPQLLKLSNIQHLYTPVHGVLDQPQTIFDLISQFHPTPALGGSPREKALAFISQHEPAPRGWYAAPIGIVNRRLEGTFSVAIRSAVTDHERVWLHAGAGIVAASDPQNEWDETALKFRPILNALEVKIGD